MSLRRGLELTRGLFQLGVIDALVLLAHTVVGDLIEATGEVGLVAVGQVATVGQVHGKYLVARLEHGEVDRGVGL